MDNEVIVLSSWRCRIDFHLFQRVGQDGEVVGEDVLRSWTRNFQVLADFLSGNSINLGVSRY